MSRIPLLGKDAATGEVAALYGVPEENHRKVPNLFATVAHHPPASLFGQLANSLRIPVDDFVGTAPPAR